MEKRALGSSGLKVSAMGLGCMTMSDFYGSDRDEQESIGTIHRALDLGVNFLDTSDLYGNGENEKLVGKAIKDEGELIFLDSHFKAEVASPYGISAAGTSETVTAMDKTITTFERIIPRLGIYYALSQAQIALFRLGWGFKDIQASDTVIKSWISEVTARLIPASRMPSETTILS